MLALDSHDWTRLEHAYGTAEDIPPLLMALADYPSDLVADYPVGHGIIEPWDTLWSSLCHQYDVYSASYAALPHIVNIALAAPDRICLSYLLLPAMIESSRQFDGSPPVQPYLADTYFASVQSLSTLVAACLKRDWNDDWARAAAMDLTAAKGFGKLAYGIHELTPEILEGFPAWAASEWQRMHPPIPAPPPPPPYLSGDGLTFTQ
jgi:hypothetical protein